MPIFARPILSLVGSQEWDGGVADQGLNEGGSELVDVVTTAADVAELDEPEDRSGQLVKESPATAIWWSMTVISASPILVRRTSPRGAARTSALLRR